MSTWHIDSDCEEAIIRLDDALCMFERATSRRYTLLLVPHNHDEVIVMSQDGKPLPSETPVTPEELLAMAIRDRARNA